MTRPHEETWEASVWLHDDQQRPLWSVCDVDAHGTRGELCEFGHDEARARLAAAAPEMARALLAVERSCGTCICGADDRYGSKDIEHFDDCALVAALRKAGVR